MFASVRIRQQKGGSIAAIITVLGLAQIIYLKWFATQQIVHKFNFIALILVTVESLSFNATSHLFFRWILRLNSMVVNLARPFVV